MSRRGGDVRSDHSGVELFHAANLLAEKLNVVRSASDDGKCAVSHRNKVFPLDAFKEEQITNELTDANKMKSCTNIICLIMAA